MWEWLLLIYVPITLWVLYRIVVALRVVLNVRRLFPVWVYTAHPKRTVAAHLAPFVYACARKQDFLEFGLGTVWWNGLGGGIRISNDRDWTEILLDLVKTFRVRNLFEIEFNVTKIWVEQFDSRITIHVLDDGYFDYAPLLEFLLSMYRKDLFVHTKRNLLDSYYCKRVDEGTYVFFFGAAKEKREDKFYI